MDGSGDFEDRRNIDSNGSDFKSTSLSLWDMQVQKADQSKWSKFEEIPVVFVLGSKSAGKTSLIYTFMGKPENPRPTLTLDFSFATRVTSNLDKEVVHLYELGGDAFKNPDLIENPILNANYLDKMSIFVILDLSKPDRIWHTLETIITYGKKAVTKHLSNLSKKDALNLAEMLEKSLEQRLGKDKDKKMEKGPIEPFPLPLVIICTHYDVFKNFEPEKRKAITRILRLASHLLGASLNFYSLKDIALNRRVKELFAHYSYGTHFPKTTNLDINKPLLIPHGGDSYDQIWVGNTQTNLNMDFLKHLFETTVGKYDEKVTIKPNPSLAPKYKDEDFDEARKRILEQVKLSDEVRDEFKITDVQFTQRI